MIMIQVLTYLRIQSTGSSYSRSELWCSPRGSLSNSVPLFQAFGSFFQLRDPHPWTFFLIWTPIISIAVAPFLALFTSGGSQSVQKESTSPGVEPALLQAFLSSHCKTAKGSFPSLANSITFGNINTSRLLVASITRLSWFFSQGEPKATVSHLCVQQAVSMVSYMDSKSISTESWANTWQIHIMS